MSTVYWIVEGMLGLAIVLSVFRVFLGPSMANRVVALDLLGVLAVGFMAVQAVRTEQYPLIDVAIAVGIIAFIGTSTFALLIDRDPGAGAEARGEATRVMDSVPSKGGEDD